MKVLYEFSRSGLKKNRHCLELIREEILDHDHTLTNDLIKDSKRYQKKLPKDIYVFLSNAIAESDCIIIEGSVVSLSLGYILTESLRSGKPVLFLIKNKQQNKKNRFVWSISSKLLTKRTYTNSDELKKEVRNFFKYTKFIKVRFNLVIRNDINNFVTHKSNRLDISKTEYITNLILKDMKSGHK